MERIVKNVFADEGRDWCKWGYTSH